MGERGLPLQPMTKHLHVPAAMSSREYSEPAKVATHVDKQATLATRLLAHAIKDLVEDLKQGGKAGHSRVRPGIAREGRVKGERVHVGEEEMGSQSRMCR